ncbi:MAG: PGF-CTERM sorting domain-containing protein [Halobacteria archaeon]
MKGAILALLAVALTGAAEARYVDNTTTNGTFVIGESDIDFAFFRVDNNANVQCTAGSITGIANSATQGVGSITVGQNFDTAGKGLVAGQYNYQCTTPAGHGQANTVTAVNPVLTASIETTNVAYPGRSITSIASGDSINFKATTNMHLLNNSTGTPSGLIGPMCEVNLNLKKDGVQAPGFPRVLNVTRAHDGATTGTGQANIVLNINNFPAGTYKASVSTIANASCNLLDATGPEVTLTVLNPGISSFTASKTTGAINEAITVSGKTSPFETVRIRLSSGNQSSFTNLSASSFETGSDVFGGMLSQTTALSNNNNSTCLNAYNPTNTGLPATTIGAQQALARAVICLNASSTGDFGVNVNFTTDGTYELAAARQRDIAAGNPQEKSVSIQVQPVSATVKTSKTQAWLGQKVEITGTASAGVSIFIAINNRFEAVSDRKTDGTFTYTWDETSTSTFSEGSVNVDVWVCPQTISDTTDTCTNGMAKANKVDTKDGICNKQAAQINANCDKSFKKAPDASWSISMKDQTVDVTSPKAGQSVALNDKFRVTGTAPGARGNVVFAWIFNEKATTSDGRCRSEKISVSSEETGFAFDKEFGKEVTDRAGDFTLVVQSLGRDGHYSDNKQSAVDDGDQDRDPIKTTENPNLACTDDTPVANSALSNKVGSQIRSILDDNARTKAGSDDQKVFRQVQFKVVNPTIKLNACASTVSGADLNVTGTSNRQDGTTVIVKAVGPKELAPVTTSVKNGTFTATFTAGTIGADIGTYTVTADDLKGQTDTVTCSVIAGSPCALSVAVKSSKAQVEKDEKATLTATVSNSGDEACTGTTLSSTVNPSAGATVTWEKTSGDVPAKGMWDVMGNFSASADGSYTVTVEAARGAAKANGSVTIGVGQAPAATPAPTGAATPAPTGAATPAPATPKPSPGFEAVFAVAGLLAVAYLVSRRNR